MLDRNRDLPKCGRLNGTALIADDHGLYRTGFGLLLKDSFGIEAIFEAASFDEAVDCLSHDPTIAIAFFDLKMPGIGGPETLSAIREAFPKLLVAIVSATEDKATILAALEAGVHGYISKSLDEEHIERAITAILNGQVYVPVSVVGRPGTAGASEVASRVGQIGTHELGTIPSRPPVADGVTARQKDVLARIQRGLSNKEIARELGISSGTVKVHLAALFAHFRARNRTDLIVKACMTPGRQDEVN
jgi:DNA-binding NarL/FixJ family response regulator